MNWLGSLWFQLCSEGLVFKGQVSECLLKPGGFPTSFVSRIEADNHRDLSNTYRLFDVLQFADCLHMLLQKLAGFCATWA